MLREKPFTPLLPPSKRLVRPNNALEAIYRLVPAHDKHVNTRNTLKTSAKCGILDSAAMSTKEELVVSVLAGPSSGESQASRGSLGSSRGMSRVPRTPPSVYATVARTEMKMAENLTVFPMRSPLGRPVPDSACPSALSPGDRASKAHAAITSIPTYANEAMEILILI
jgi:hypothetical protein